MSATAYLDHASAIEFGPVAQRRAEPATERLMPEDDAQALRHVCYILLAIVTVGTLLMLGTVLYTL